MTTKCKDRKEKITRAVMKVDIYQVLVGVVEEGVALGLNRARKHTDRPDDDLIVDRITCAIMDGISVYFDFET